MRDETKLFYDINAEKIADEWNGKNTMMPTIEEFLDILPDRPKILDLGCGPGYESMRLSSLGADVVGIDYSEESIRIAREHYEFVRECELQDNVDENRWRCYILQNIAMK